MSPQAVHAPLKRGNTNATGAVKATSPLVTSSRSLEINDRRSSAHTSRPTNEHDHNQKDRDRHTAKKGSDSSSDRNSRRYDGNKSSDSYDRDRDRSDHESHTSTAHRHYGTSSQYAERRSQHSDHRREEFQSEQYSTRNDRTRSTTGRRSVSPRYSRNSPSETSGRLPLRRSRSPQTRHHKQYDSTARQNKSAAGTEQNVTHFLDYAQIQVGHMRQNGEAVLHQHDLDARQTEMGQDTESPISSKTQTDHSVFRATTANGAEASVSVKRSASTPDEQERPRKAIKTNEAPEATSSIEVQPTADMIVAGDQDDDDDSASDISDMFADPDEIKEKKPKNPKTDGPIVAKPLDASVDTDDHEGYYKFFKHELMYKRYIIIERLGKGSYATVFRALDVQDNNNPVAIKIIRNNAMMTQGAKEETEMLRRIHDFLEQHTEYERSIVDLKGHFMHRKHFCMVFENMGYNLRDVLDKSKGGHDTGVNISAVVRFAKQMFSGLRSLKELGVFHGDLKPDNILMNPGPNPNYIKIADLGTARKDHGAEHGLNTSDLLEMRGEMGSRFYRPPEVILGIIYGSDMDVWAAGCTLFEIFTGKILFTGIDNCDMLFKMQKTLGHIPRKYFRQGVFFEQYFDDDVNAQFIRTTTTPTGLINREKFANLGPRRPIDPETILARLREAASDSNDKEEMAKIDRLADLITKCLVFDHNKRIGPHGALEHPFITGIVPAPISKPAKAAPKPLFTPSSVGNTKRLQTKRAEEEARRKKMALGYAKAAVIESAEVSRASSVQTEESVEEKVEEAPRRKGFKFGSFKPVAK